ncbi:MAG: type II toxin-antitoxin system HicB family antitoxin [Nitrospirae bacterium]|nr:type II toxin-antitoxin system HicB family antitoxin [Nitrospirota bacterium]
MILFYPARITHVPEDRKYLVEFPDLPGCLTDGATFEDAKRNAKEALTGYLASAFEKGQYIPEPSTARSRGLYFIEPEPEVSVPIVIRRLREASNLTQPDVADALGIALQAYQRIEKPGKSNPTLKTLARLAKVFGKELHLEFA